jgi:transcriptional regulator with XRE-family HTH domain
VDRQALADFLRRRRLVLHPAELGLDSPGRRQTPGLRREEVASRAFMSTDFYTRLEQARGSRPSPETAEALASALRLTPAERRHLFELAGHNPPRPAFRSDGPSPGLVRVMERMDLPAQIVSDLGVTLAQNHLARALVGEQTGFSGPARSVIYRWFTDPSSRSFHPEDEHARISRDHVASLRAVHGAPRDDPDADELVSVLLERSKEFAALWERHEITDRSGSVKRFRNPLAGELVLDCQILTSENVTERLVVFTPLPGSDDADKLDLLAMPNEQRPEESPAPQRHPSGVPTFATGSQSPRTAAKQDEQRGLHRPDGRR